MDFTIRTLMICGLLLAGSLNCRAQFNKSRKLDKDRGIGEIKLGAKLKDFPELTFATEELFRYDSPGNNPLDYLDAIAKLPTERWYTRKEENRFLDDIIITHVYYGFMEGKLTRIVGFFKYEDAERVQQAFFIRYGLPDRLPVIAPLQTEAIGWRGEKVILTMDGDFSWHFTLYLEEAEIRKVNAYCSEGWQQMAVRNYWFIKKPENLVDQRTKAQLRQETKAAMKDCQQKFQNRLKAHEAWMARYRNSEKLEKRLFSNF